MNFTKLLISCKEEARGVEPSIQPAHTKQT